MQDLTLDYVSSYASQRKSRSETYRALKVPRFPEIGVLNFVMFFVYVAALIVGGAVTSQWGPAPYAALLGIVTAALAIYLVRRAWIGPTTDRYVDRRMSKIVPLLPIKFKTDSNGIWSETEFVAHFIAWSGIDNIVETSGGIVAACGLLSAIYLPRSAFSSEAAMNKFAEDLRLLAAARRNASGSDPTSR